MKAQQEAANKELEKLRLRHIQDLEEAKVAGVSEGIMIHLREDHVNELRLMKQNQRLKEEMMKTKREEVQTLLVSATGQRLQMRLMLMQTMVILLYAPVNWHWNVLVHSLVPYPNTRRCTHQGLIQTLQMRLRVR
jgi:hypothetical protein